MKLVLFEGERVRCTVGTPRGGERLPRPGTGAEVDNVNSRGFLTAMG